MKTAMDHHSILFGEFSVSFQRTLRIPDDGRAYPLPPGLGTFPVRRVDDFASTVPAEWRDHGGVFVPMYQREAMWLSFAGPGWLPFAVKVGIGKVCAITGERWTEGLAASPQNYIVAPPQPWLDGIATAKGTIRQFVAMPLGLGYTVEGQVTGEERTGGLQLKVFASKAGRFLPPPPPPRLPPCAPVVRGSAAFGAPGTASVACAMPQGNAYRSPAMAPQPASGAMGFAAGGTMKQKIYPDPHGIATWDGANTARVFVHLVNSELWRQITGEEAPTTPVTAKEYARRGLPWFDLYDEPMGALAGSESLAKVKSVKEVDGANSGLPLQDDDSVSTPEVKRIGMPGVDSVRDGAW